MDSWDKSSASCLQVIKIDIHSHQPSIDAVHAAGREVIKSEAGAQATDARDKLDELNNKWESALSKMRDRRILLEDALKDVRQFSGICRLEKRFPIGIDAKI